MKKNRSNEKHRIKQAGEVREALISSMADSSPDPDAVKRFNRPAYQSIDVMEYVRKKGYVESGRIQRSDRGESREGV